MLLGRLGVRLPQANETLICTGVKHRTQETAKVLTAVGHIDLRLETHIPEGCQVHCYT